MSQIVIEQALSSRYRPSGEADRQNTIVMEGLVLSTRAAAARLAIGRSLSIPHMAIEGNPNPTIDARGVEVQGQTLFSVNDIAAWIGLIVTHGKLYGTTIETLDDFKTAVRFHWHRGAQLLYSDWNECDRNYDQFVKILITRRASLRGGKSGHVEEGDDKADPFSNDKVRNLEVVKALSELGIAAEERAVHVGPRITRYEISLVDVGQFDRLRKNLRQLALSLGVNTGAPLLSPGNEAKSVLLDFARTPDEWNQIRFSDLERWNASRKDSAALPVFVGLDLSGKNVSFDLASAPHLLIGGATGMGKSVCVHTLILSLLLNRSKGDLELALIDPKQVEFSPYASLDCLFDGTIVSEVAGALKLLQRLVTEMDERYTGFKALGVANIADARAAGLALPYLVVFVEEFADLVLQNKQIEPLVVRLAQKARAAGIHLVLATQRPDAKTFSGLIRSNVPARIALTVQKAVESNIILDEGGAESLSGPGDMLVKLSGQASIRAHGPLITLDDIRSVIQRL